MEPPMPIHLIRHGHAGHRKSWHGPDGERPLSSRGQREAKCLADELSDAGIDLLWSSPYVRCRQTLDPLADTLGLEVIDQEALAEGAKGTTSLAALVDAAAGHVVAASTHGDVVTAIVKAAVDRGARVSGPASLAKGARYVVEVVDGNVSTLTHVPAPDA